MTRLMRIFFFVAAMVSVHTGQAQQTMPVPHAKVTAYPESSDGLRQFLEDIMRAAESRNTPTELILINSLIMPRESTWFTDKFGVAFGPRLAAAYESTEAGLVDQMRTVFEADVQHGLRVPKIFQYNDPTKVDSPVDSYLNCMNEISPLYETAFNGDRPAVQLGPDPSAPGRMRQVAGDLRGYYVYAAGGFRFVPGNVLMFLPEQRPLRIQLDMDVMKSKITHRVEWGYPTQAIRQHIKGKVVVHLILDTTGTVNAVGPIEGPPVLADTVVPAVKQWTFAPTTLDGDPVEVDLKFEANFQ